MEISEEELLKDIETLSPEAFAEKYTGFTVEIEEDIDTIAANAASNMRRPNPKTPNKVSVPLTKPVVDNKTGSNVYAPKTKLNTTKALGESKDEDMSDAAHELVLHADNSSGLYHSSHLPIVKNLEKKFKAGKYDHEKAVKLWKYHADRAGQDYHKQHGNAYTPWHKMFSPKDREQAARHFAGEHKVEMEAGNFHESFDYSNSPLVEEVMTESLKLLTSYTSPSGKHEAKVYKDTEWGEHRVKFFTHGKHHKNADYHGSGDEPEDAHDTAKAELKRMDKFHTEATQLGEAKTKYKPDVHFSMQKPDMRKKINYQIRKGKSYWDAVQAAKGQQHEEVLDEKDNTGPRTAAEYSARYGKGAKKKKAHEKAETEKEEKMEESVEQPKMSVDSYMSRNFAVEKSIREIMAQGRDIREEARIAEAKRAGILKDD